LVDTKVRWEKVGITASVSFSLKDMVIFLLFSRGASAAVLKIFSRVSSALSLTVNCPELCYDASKNMRVVVEVLRAVDLKRVGSRGTAAVSRGAEMQGYIHQN